MQLLIAGDMVPTQSNLELFNDADIKSLLGEKLLSIWNAADIRIFNLEVPLVDEKETLLKCGPNLIAPVSTIKGVKALNPSLIALANNHILDQGEQGLISTRNILNRNKLPYVGVGDNLEEANKPYVIKINGLYIGVYNCAEHEFSIATKTTSGANPFDPLESFDHISKLKEKCDYVIVLYHGGKEHYRYPTPYIQKICRKMVQNGADLIVCQHSHCIGCVENYKNSTIVYGQGNFIFDHSNSEYWQTSLLIRVEINDGLQINYIPIVKNESVIRLAEEHEGEKILLSFIKRSEKILQNGFIQEKYKEFAKENIEIYLTNFAGINKWVSRIDRYFLKGKLLKKRYNIKKTLAIQNYVECESHRELFLEGIKARRNDL